MNNQSNPYNNSGYTQRQYNPYTPVQQPVRAAGAPIPLPGTSVPAQSPSSGGSGSGFWSKKTVVGMIIGFLACALIGASAMFVWLSAGGTSHPAVQNTAGSQQSEIQLNTSTSPTSNTAAPANEGDALTYAQIASKVKPSVVGITAYATSNYGYGETAYSQGSGIILTSDGYVVTNSHVIGDEASRKYKITVTVSDANHDAEEFSATVIGYDTKADLAILKIDATGLIPAEIGDSTALVSGDEVVAIGNPGGSQFAGSVTNGIVSGVDRIIDHSGASSDSAMKYLQTNAAINPGNSGGALVNIYGQVIGINTAKIVADGYEGLGFAIPMSAAQPIISQLISSGTVARPVLGITCKVVGEQESQTYDIPVGLKIVSINASSDLNGKAAIGDIITKCDGTDISTLSELQSVIEAKKVGDSVTLTIYRHSEAATFDITIKLVAAS